jgi:hypothetical protein
MASDGVSEEKKKKKKSSRQWLEMIRVGCEIVVLESGLQSGRVLDRQRQWGS